MGLEKALNYLGNWGRYQVITYLSIVISMTWPSSWQIFGIVFEGPSVPLNFGCNPDRDIGYVVNAGTSNFLCEENLYVTKINTTDEISYEYRSKYLNQTHENYTFYYSKNKTQECSKFEYFPNETGFIIPKVNGSIQQKWNLVCKNRKWVTWSQLIFNAGSMSGALLCPMFGDNFGRKKIFFLCQILMCAFGIGMAYSPNIIAFSCFQYITAIFSFGNTLMGYVMASELFPKDMRSVLSPLLYVFFALGSAFLTVFAKLVPQWSDFQLAISIAPFITFLYYPFCPESWRWLFAKGKYKEAEKWLNRAAKFNSLKPIPKEILYDDNRNICIDDERILGADQTFLNYIRKPKLLIYFCAMSFLLFSSNLVYFGLNLMSGSMAGDPYINFAALTLVEILGVILAVCTVSFLGRRYPVCFFFIWGSIFLALAVIFTKVNYFENYFGVETNGKWINSFTIIGKIGITASYCVILVYIQEIFPTYIRSTGIGFSSGLGGIGSLISPIVLLSSNLEYSKYWIPVSLFAVLSFVAGLVTLLLPETVGRELPTTIEDVLNLPYSLSKKEWSVARMQSYKILFFKDKISNTTEFHENQAFEDGTPNISSISINIKIN